MSATQVSRYNEPFSKNTDEVPVTRSKREIASAHFKEYAEGTSLHGIKYIGEDGRHIIER